jgi:hypothetical protein
LRQALPKPPQQAAAWRFVPGFLAFRGRVHGRDQRGTRQWLHGRVHRTVLAEQGKNTRKL